MGRADQAVARTDSVRIKLSPEMVERLEKLALSYGMPVSTMGAFAVADWINKQEQHQSLARMAVMEATRKGLEQFSGEALEKALSAALPAITVAMAKEGYMLDHDAADKAAQ